MILSDNDLLAKMAEALRLFQEGQFIQSRAIAALAPIVRHLEARAAVADRHEGSWTAGAATDCPSVPFEAG